MEVAMSNRVVARNSLGRFIKECEDAGEKTVKDLIEMGAEESRSLAPVGHKHDMRTIPLNQSISAKMTSRTSGYWEARARHALPIEFGAGPHQIHGSPFLRFYWESMGRMWIPGLNGPQDIVNHPGNAAQPYLRPAYHMVSSISMQVAAARYPG